MEESTVALVLFGGFPASSKSFVNTTNNMGFDDEAQESLIESDKSVKRVRKHRLPYELIISWSLTFFFFCTTLYFALQQAPVPVPVPEKCSSNSSNNNSYETGFETDFVSTDPIPLNLIKKKFTNDLLFNTTSQTFYNQPNNASETKYINDPSTSPLEINKAWHSLLHAQYVSITESEAGQFPPSHIAPISYDGEHSFMELSVFHNLHCLNEIRLALDKDHESGEESMHAGGVHLDHCVDQIRQALMCHADLTPVPMLPVLGVQGGEYVGNGEPHTCRDFDAIWEWVEKRGRMQKALGD